MTHNDRPLLGIGLMLLFCLFAPMGDGMAKYLGPYVALSTLILTRFAVQAAILTPMRWSQLRVDWRLNRLIIARSILQIGGIGAMFLSLRYLPIADAVAIAFVMPFLMLLLGKYVLGEEIGPQRLGACGVGFIGTLLVIQPNFAQVGLPALLPLCVAVIFALFMMITRQIAKEVDPIALQALTGLYGLPILIPLVWMTPDAIPDTSFMWHLLVLGLLGTLGHLAMSWSLRYAPASTLAPMQYLEIPISALVGWVFFSDLPNGLAALGIVITVGAGIYIILRERAIARRPAVPTAP
ncbi:DMT family transporter [Aestuariibius sp. HNIBRBA575]|uniref:DMT family transporter n=1 Tax=Aestuariibius sp. HNIBRBA575 TaxID=3233343 RepID=UPI0034A557E1